VCSMKCIDVAHRICSLPNSGDAASSMDDVQGKIVNSLKTQKFRGSGGWRGARAAWRGVVSYVAWSTTTDNWVSLFFPRPLFSRKAKEGDSEVGKEFWRQDESLKIERLVQSAIHPIVRPAQ